MRPTPPTAVANMQRQRNHWEISLPTLFISSRPRKKKTSARPWCCSNPALKDLNLSSSSGPGGSSMISTTRSPSETSSERDMEVSLWRILYYIKKPH